MQPPPRTVPSGAAGPPPSAAGHPNAFRRARPDRPGNSTMMLGLAQPVPVMTDPFAFGRQVPSTMSTGNHAQSQKSSPHPMQTPPPVGFPQTAPVQGQSTPPYPQEGAQGPHPVSSSFSLSSHTPEMSFTPNSAVSQAHQSGHSFTSTNLAGMEQNNLNSMEHLPYIMQGAPPYGSAPVQSQLLYGQEFKGDPISYAPLVPSAMPLQAQTMQPTASHWMTDNGSRPPSVQNYFQPTSDHPSQPFNVSPLAPPVTLSPHAQQTAPSPDTPRSSPSPYAAPHNLHPNPNHPAKLGPSGSHSTAPVPDPAWHQEPVRNTEVSQHQNFPIQAQTYLSQNYADSDPSFSQPSQEHFYHQMGGDPGSSRSDSTNSATNSGQAGPGPYITDPGTISMFFKGNDVENEEILAGDGKVVNGVPGGNTSVTTHGRFLNPVLPNHQGPPSQLLPGTETAHGGCLNLVGDRNAQPTGEVAALYMNDSGFDSGTPKQGGQFDHVENLECVPNLEVLPSEPQKMASKPQNISDNMLPGLANTAIQVGAHYEGGPNLETPDSVPRPVRPESVSSSYSNVSHGSASSSRRHQGVVGTFIQQEIAKPSEESSAGYFEQVDTSPAGESAQQNMSNRMYHSQLSQQLTPSPPKPTGIFQASANSSFEPVRSQIVGVRPFEVDQARMVMESSSGPPRMAVSDVSPGNLEQPPDNLENIFMPSAQHPEGLPSLQERRPSSRAHGPRLMCESPATTLWAQNENPILGANILLAPAAPPVHGPVKPPSAEVIQPPEDGPLNLQAPQNALLPLQKPESSSENLENPPKVGDGDPKNPQASLNYASLLVTSPSAESFQNQPVLIAPPATSCNVIPPNNSVNMANQIISNEKAGAGIGSLLMPQSSETSGAHAMPIATSKTANNLPHLISSQVIPPGDLSNRSSLNPTPLNLAPISRQIQKPENTPVASTSRPPNPLVSGADSLGGLTHSTTSFNSQAAPAANDPKQSTNYELLDFTMHHSQNHNEAPDLGSYVPSGVSQQVPTLALGAKSCVPVSNTTGFYLQVTKDAQQGGRGGRERQAQALADPAAYIQQPAPDSSRLPETQPNLHGQGDASSNQPSPALPQNNQYPHPLPPGPGAPVLPGTLFSGPGDSQPPPYSQQPGNPSQPPPPDPQRPPSVLGVQPGYMVAPPIPGPGYGNYYGAPYSEYLDGRPPYPPQYPPSDPRFQQYYQDDPHRRYDPRYPGYEGPNPSYRDTERYQPREQPERPSSRASQYSDRPSSRQGYPANYQGPVRSAYDAYYADYYKKPQEFGDRSRWEHYDPAAAYDPRYRGYYDQSYWYNYEPEAYRHREAYFNQPYPNRREGYDDQWRYDPRYDSSFDDDYRRQRDPYGDECDRHSVHSEQSAHSLPSSHSHHSRRSSFSAHSQQSQVYRSQQDLVAAGYEPPGQPTSLPVDYSYGQYPDNVDGSQAYVGYQYPTGYPTDSGWPAAEERPPKPSTPEKYAVPHRCARFGPGGQMIQVLPNLPSAGQPALVEIHSMETMLQNSQEQEDFRSFPGPLVKEETHKVDVIKFAQNKSLECMRNDSLIDKDSALLIWEFIVLLCRQNGTVVGTDIADLLLKEHKSVWLPGKSPNEANLIDFNNEPLERADDEPGSGLLSLLSDTFMIVPENAGKETERFRELLLFGRKKDALESAMKNGLWGHALLLASKMDNRTHARVMTRFANSLPINDPLQTVYQLMSGRMPAAATCCGDEKWGDWRPHLAMVLSNLTQTLDLDTRTIATMGDTLASKGLIDAAHFCYMMAQVGLGVYTKKSTKMVLIGANHSLPFLKFASNEAIQRTEAYEYAQSLGSQPCSLPNFQVFKFIYACRLAEAGLCAQAFHYCEVTSRAVLSYPTYHSPSFISQLAQMSAKLRFFDPQLKERPEQELFIEPDWLVHLKHLERQIKDGTFSYSTDRVTPQQYACSTPSSEFDQSSPPDPTGLPSDMAAGPENPLMSSLLPNPGPTPQGVQLMPPAPPTILDEGMASMPQSPPTTDGVKFYPVPPTQVVPTLGPVPSTQGPTPGAFPTIPGYGSIYQPEQPEMYSGPPTHPQVPSQLPPGEPLPTPLEQQVSQQGSSQPSSPTRPGLNTQMDFYDQMARMGPGRRSRTTSQSSMLMSPGRRSRTPSESSSHSTGRERSNSAAKQSSPPPPPIPEQPNRQEEPAKPKKDSPKKGGGGGGGGGGGWLNWLYRKGKNEAHLPDDKNKSIVWDEKKQRWVNMDEPEEESKPPPPPPSCFPKMGPQMGPGGPGGPPSGGPQVNMFSRKAGTRSRYVDVLNPGGTSAKPGVSAPAPADLFAPLAPMAMPANLFVPGADEQQPMEGSTAEMGGSPGQSTAPQVSNPTLYPPGQEGAPIMEGTRSEELSRSSSMSSLSREVSQHLNQVPSQPPVQGAPAPGGVIFYNPTQFAQPNAPSAGRGRIGQRKYPTLK